MFSFFKKKTKCEESATDEYLEKNEEKKSDEDNLLQLSEQESNLL